MNIKRLLSKAKDVKIKDYLSVFPMTVGLILSPLYRNAYRNTWGIGERKDEARDNGYHFFKYMVKNHPEQRCIYAIDRNCRDYQRVAALGETVQHGSVKHWILYFTCKYLISSQAFKPNGYICTLIERAGFFRPSHVFLQHGITKDKAEFLYAKYRRAKFFIAGAQPEFEFMKEKFGYPDGTMQYTGFARFDALHETEVAKNRILIMPTWRKWLRFKSEAHADAKMNIDTSEYAAGWQALLKSEKLQQMIREYNLDIVFYPHPNMKGILHPEALAGLGIRIADVEKDDLQELMKSSAMMITDYSSVFFDMVYMKKPVIFYQFDEKLFRKYHYQQGWFDYHKTSFGNSCGTSEEVLKELDKIIKNNFSVSNDFLTEHRAVFKLYDTNNSKRIYDVISEKTLQGKKA